jgi:uncharacterized YccA/Bax inhibitor family protein
MLLFCTNCIQWLICGWFNEVTTQSYQLLKAIIGLILVVFLQNPNIHPISTWIMLFEDLFIGGISAIFEARYPGIVIQAVGATFVTFAVCLDYINLK